MEFSEVVKNRYSCKKFSARKLDGAKLRVGVRNLKLRMKKIHCKIDKSSFPKYKGKMSVDCGTENVSVVCGGEG